MHGLLLNDSEERVRHILRQRFASFRVCIQHRAFEPTHMCILEDERMHGSKRSVRLITAMKETELDFLLTCGLSFIFPGAFSRIRRYSGTRYA